jgi:tetratricopeptide (TPR) repeat protein
MPSEIKIDPRRDFVRRVLPWLVAAIMLAVYVLTLNPWISLFNLNVVARISGWLWVPDIQTPLYQLVTLLFRVLPTASIPLALNLFSAVCAAAALGLLARSVGLLPHDRTEAQVARERNDFALLTLGGAWLPPLLAALLCGLQLTFWESATNGGNQMFDLLLFAFLIWSLLEYRLDERDSRLYWCAAVVGAGMVEDPAVLGFFPVFFTSIIWVKGFNFFNWQFLRRMTLCGLAGFSIFLLLPVVAALFSDTPGTLGQWVKLGLAPQIQVIKFYFYCITNPMQYLEDLLMPLFISLMPLLLLSIRWKIGDSTRMGALLANLMFHTIHAIFLGVCLWLVFDPPFSPRVRGFGLTLYYFIALSAGYYAGYFLLIFGRKRSRALEPQPAVVTFFNWCVVAGVWVVAILAVTGLVYKNAPLIRMVNAGTMSQLASLIIQKLPRNGAIVLSDDPERLFLTQAALAREGRTKDFVMVDTASLPFPEYHRYLHRESPQKWPLLISNKQTGTLNAFGLLQILSYLSTSNELYYLHPSFGYYFEQFYLEPHGLVYRLKDLPGDTLLPPPPDEDLIAENETFWSEAQAQGLNAVESALAPAEDTPQTFVQKQLARLHVPLEGNLNAAVAGAYCSRSANFWGVESQRAGELTNAAEAFQTALRLNPDNVIAQINLNFNRQLQAGYRPFVDLTKTGPDYLGNKFNSISAAITTDGPFDEPSFCFYYGYTLAEVNNFYRQAAEQFQRVHQFDPGYLPARLWLARIYGLNHLPDQMLEILREPMDHPQQFFLAPEDSTQINILAAAAYFQKNDVTQGSHLFEMEISRNPDNDDLLTTAARIYISRGMYSNALEVANLKLSRSPNNLTWLLVKGYVENQLKQYDDAIVTLNHALAIQKDSPDALLQRANAYFNSGKLAKAQTDYEAVQQTHNNSPEVAYGLGEIAWHEYNTNEAIRNFEIYLAGSPTNSAETKTVLEQLHGLKQPAADK